MPRFRWLSIILVVIPVAGFALGFSTQPTFYPLKPDMGFDMGEAAVNSFLAQDLKGEMTVYSGGVPVMVRFRKAEVDFEPGECVLSLRMQVRFQVGSVARTELISYDSPLLASSVTYSITTGQVTAMLPNFLQGNGTLPDYVRSALISKFQYFPLYAHRLVSGLSGSAYVPSEIGTQVAVPGISGLPAFYMGTAPFATSYQKDFVRFTGGPSWHVEDMKVQVYRDHPGGYVPAVAPSRGGSGTPEYLYNRITVITNFPAEITGLLVTTASGGRAPTITTLLSLSGTRPVGPTGLQFETESTSVRYKRYNFVTPVFKGGVGTYNFVITLKAGPRNVYVSGSYDQPYVYKTVGRTTVVTGISTASGYFSTSME